MARVIPGDRIYHRVLKVEGVVIATQVNGPNMNLIQIEGSLPFQAHQADLERREETPLPPRVKTPKPEVKKQQSVQIQYVGRVEAIPAKEVKAGMKMMFNFGHVSEILEVIPNKSGSSYTLVVADQSGQPYKMQKRAETLIAAYY